MQRQQPNKDKGWKGKAEKYNLIFTWYHIAERPLFEIMSLKTNNEAILTKINKKKTIAIIISVYCKLHI